MNKIKVMTGQVWECEIKAPFCDIGEQAKIVKLLGDDSDNDFIYIGHGDNLNWLCPTSESLSTNELLYKYFEFIPQTDLEWLAVKVDEWVECHGFLHKNGNNYCFSNLQTRITYTKQQWQNKRYELGLDEFKIKIPTKWLNEKGIKIVNGDTWLNNSGTGVVNDCNSHNFNNSDDASELFITAFAERENAGVQPVADWVPINTRHINDATWENIKSSDISWPIDVYGYMTHYTPNIEELYKIYLAEQKSIVVNKGIADALIRGEAKLMEFGKLKLTKDDVGKEFGINLRTIELVYANKQQNTFVFEYADGLLLVTDKFGVHGTGTQVIRIPDPRWWLKDLPDADLYFYKWISCDVDGFWQTHQSEPQIKESGNFTCSHHSNSLQGIIMPTLKGNEWKLSKISIDELREWQDKNKKI